MDKSYIYYIFYGKMIV